MDMVDRAVKDARMLVDQEAVVDGNSFIHDLIKNCNSMRSRIWEAEARIEELEDAIKEEKSWVSQYQEWLIEEVAARMSENGYAEEFRQAATETLITDGKIGPDIKSMYWKITEERKNAINELAGLLTDIGCPQCHRYLQKKHGDNVAVLKAMLEEAK